MFYAPVLAIVQSPHTELRRGRSTSTRHLLVPVVLADNMPPLQNPLYNIGWVEEFCPGIYHVTMFQLHPGSIYVSSFSIIFLACRTYTNMQLHPSTIVALTSVAMSTSNALASTWRGNLAGSKGSPTIKAPKKRWRFNVQVVFVGGLPSMCELPQPLQPGPPPTRKSHHISTYIGSEWISTKIKDLWEESPVTSEAIKVATDLKVNCWVARLTSPSVRNGKLNGWAWKNPIANAGTPTHFLEIECTKCSRVSCKVSHGETIAESWNPGKIPWHW